MGDADSGRRGSLRRYGVVAGIVLLVLAAFPGRWMLNGYRFARHAAQNGIRAEASVKLDGFGLSLRASQDSLDKKVEFNRTLYEQMGNIQHVKDRYGASEGLNGFFFGLGTRVGCAP